MARLVVLGSINHDLTVTVERHPVPGETVLGGSIAHGLGGKGSNQAAAAARSGADVAFVGAVGDDDAGRGLRSELAARGVDVEQLAVTAEPTGMALITVDASGENTIVVVAGANGALDAAHANAAAALLSPGAVLLCQLEVPVDVVLAAARAAAATKARFVLNLAPYRAVPDELIALADPLIVNESEASELAGRPIDSVQSATEAARALLSRARSVVITLGGDGAIAARDGSASHHPAPRVPVVDTTGAGDAFVGALSARLAEGDDFTTAVDAGIAAGAIAVQHVGAQPPIDAA